VETIRLVETCVFAAMICCSASAEIAQPIPGACQHGSAILFVHGIEDSGLFVHAIGTSAAAAPNHSAPCSAAIGEPQL
jgi:hypothetical protein